MSCRCPQCDWPIKTKQTVRIKCAKCGVEVMCGEGPLPEEKPPKPVPREQWPAWAVALVRLKSQQDIGVGDTIQRVAAWFGGEWFKLFAKKIGMPCGCTSRQARFNAMYPY